METKYKAEEILQYCMDYLGTYTTDRKFKKTKLYKEMLKEIEFMIDTD